MRSWTARNWLWAAAGFAAMAVFTGMVTDLLPNPLFTRMIEAPWWAYPVWIAAAILSGLLIATYATDRAVPGRRNGQRHGAIGAVLSFLAVGCPTCNTLVVVALGTNGAVNFFGPLQPVLAIGSLALLGYALRARLRTARACPVPATGRP